MNWSTHYPAYFNQHGTPSTDPSKAVEFADIGCGFGGLLVSLAPLFPDKLMLGSSSRLLLCFPDQPLISFSTNPGMEIRQQVTQYVTDKIRALRLSPNSIDPDNPNDVTRTEDLKKAPEGYKYDNVSVLRGNAMKFLGNFFEKAQVGLSFSLSLSLSF